MKKKEQADRDLYNNKARGEESMQYNIKLCEGMNGN